MHRIERLYKRFGLSLRNLLGTQAIQQIAIDDYIRRNLLENPRYQDPKKLNQFERQVYSQSGEDGIIDEIFRRIQVTNRFFVEFGVGDGLENNTTFLLTEGWTGYWIESNTNCVKDIERHFRFMIDKKDLVIRKALVTASNIEELFQEASLPTEFDLLSIDIDGNDYWVWKAIENYHPRVVVIEYNALYPPHAAWVQEYNADWIWNRSSHSGASLKALELLGKVKGYRLVGCNFLGANAFFVQEGLVDDKFQEPFNAENHYEPPRYFLRRTLGHRRGFGRFTRI
jgi:hypothetical protein